MSAIEFVVRDGAGALNRGFVGGDGVNTPLLAQVGSDISLRLERTQILSYGRRGQALEITLVDGQVVVIENFFAPDGMPQSDLYISANGILSEVALAEGPGGTYFSTYIDDDTVGKWGPDEDLYFLDGPAIQLAGVVDEPAGMLNTGFLTGLPLLPAALLGAAALVPTLGRGDDDTTVLPDVEVRPDPVGEILAGTVENGTIVNAEDHADGVDISGTGTVGATVVVTVGDSTQQTVIDTDGNWSVTFPPEDIPTGTYETPVNVEITLDGRDIELEETLSVDTEAFVSFEEDAVGGEGIVNAGEAAAPVTLTGETEAGSTVIVTVEGVDYTATVTGETWTVSLPAGTLAEGEYLQGVTVTATDSVGNTAVTTGDFTVDTVTNVAVATATIGGNGVVNAQEHASGFTVTGTAEAGATVVVTLGTATLDATADANGNWSVYVTSSDVAPGTYQTTVTAVATDIAGNTATASGTIQIDTEMSVTVDTASVEIDGRVNATEASDGVTITGTAEAGSAVTVVMGSVTHTTTATANGTWSVTYAANEIAQGTYTADVQVSATDLAGNTATTSGTLEIDTVVRVTFDANAVGGDGTVNAAEAGSVVLTGTNERGSTVVVTLDGVDYNAVVTGGTWSLTLPAADVQPGTYAQNVTVTATDGFGNTATTSGTYNVDTETDVTVNTSRVETDGIVNAVERSDGVTLTGTAEPRATVEVTMNGVTHTVVASRNGTWSADFTASEVPTGETNAAVSVVSTDRAGNTATATGSVRIDTVTAVTVDTASVEGDGMVNAAERADGVVLTGTAEAGATVAVTMAGTTHTVVASANGTWSANFAASEVPQGERNVGVTVNSTDLAGNTATATGTVRVDTVTAVTVDTSDIEGDGIVNFVERSDGITLDGTAEAGATVVVTLGGASRTVTADSSGTWTADFNANQVPSGETTAPVTVTATDLAGNTATATDTVRIDTFVNALDVTSGPIGGDGIINNAERGQPITLTGIVEPGSTVVVTMAGIAATATVAADGAWTVTYPANAIPTGEYDTTMVVHATDAAGNTAELSQDVRVDTVAGYLTLSPEPIEGDDIVNAVERADGVLIYGTATPGMTVTVTLGTAVRTTVADADGNYATTFPGASIPVGTYNSPITATITDDAGNTLSVSDSVRIDTELPFTLTRPIEGDDVINRAESLDGVVLSGTVEPGSTVVVTFAGVTRTVTAGSTGTWSITYPASSIPQGESMQTVNATATDRAGNTANITHQVRVDTIVNTLTANGPVEGDDMVNRAEAADGITLTGTVEVGSTVMVTFEGVTRAATVASNGNWTVDFSAAEIPPGEYTTTVNIDATDAYGNTRSITDSFAVDTSPPEAPAIITTTSFANSGGVRQFTTAMTDDTVQVYQVSGSGGVTNANAVVREDTDFNELVFSFRNPVPNGSHLVLTASDDSGNSTGVLFVLEETNNNTVDILNPGLNQFDIEAVDLQFAEDSVLTLTASDLEALSAHSNTLTVHGGQDDTVNIVGATATGETSQIDGRTYVHYELGTNGGSLIIDDSINVNTMP